MNKIFVRNLTVIKFRWALAISGVALTAQVFAQAPAPTPNQVRPGSPAARQGAAPARAATDTNEQKALELEADRTPTLITKGSLPDQERYAADRHAGHSPQYRSADSKWQDRHYR